MEKKHLSGYVLSGYVLLECNLTGLVVVSYDLDSALYIYILAPLLAFAVIL